MSEPTAFEQMMLEYINQARMDPQGEFDRFILSTSPRQAIEFQITQALNYFNVDLNLYQQQLAGLNAVAPLAWNGLLGDAARAHSQLMIDYDDQSHQLPGEAGLGPRISATGYVWSALGENVFAYTESPAYGHAGFFIDWGFGPGGIQSPAGHRNNIMSPSFTEVGIGVLAENDPATEVGPYVVTQDFGNRPGYKSQFVGVVYQDNDVDAFYSMGEGIGGMSIQLLKPGGAAASTSSQGAGGYAIEGAAGLNTLTFSGGGLAGSVSVEVMFGAANVKLDLVDGDTVLSSADAILGAGALNLRLLGQFDTKATGNDQANELTGSLGDNLIVGLDGSDVLSGAAGNDTIKGGVGFDVLYGDSGNDELLGAGNGDTLYGGDGDDVLKGGGGPDLLEGGAGADRLFGHNAGDVLDGGEGDDVLSGGGGADELLGGPGDDALYAQGANDVLVGGSGNDTLLGGTGEDRFVFDVGSGSDIVGDFTSGEDVLDFSLLDISFALLDVDEQSGSTLLTTPGGDNVLLLDILPADLDPVLDFLF